MKNFRFLLSREWIGYLAFLVVFAVICIFLSNWQFDRRQQAATRNASIAANWDAEPQDLFSVLPGGQTVDDSTRYLPVRVTGTYLTKDELLVRNRTYNGQTGFEQLVPIRDEASGEIFIVSRGWIASDSQGAAPASVPQPASGEVSIVARLNAGEQSLGRTSPDGQIASIALPDIAATLASDGVTDTVFTGGYGLLVSETPDVGTALAGADKPTFDEGMHLSYAFQWIAFAVLGVIGFVYALRTTRRQMREDAEERAEAEKAAAGEDPVEGGAADDGDSDDAASVIKPEYGLGMRRRRTAKTDPDAEYEDAVLDGHVRRG